MALLPIQVIGGQAPPRPAPRGLNIGLALMDEACSRRSSFRIQGSANRATIADRETGAMVRVLGSDPRRLHGAAPWPPERVEPMLAALKTSRGQNTGQQGTMARHAAKRSRPSVSARIRGAWCRLLVMLRGAEGCAAVPALDLETSESGARSLARS